MFSSLIRTGTLDSLQIIGRSPAITRLKARIPYLSAQAEPFVIIGETGVGKTLLAKAIHARGPRRSLKLSSVNFSVLSERDQRLELVGACPPELNTNHPSCLEPPSTIVLKHIDYADPFLQEQLAEALETRTVTRLGSNTPQFVLGRVIFTLRQPLRTLYREGRITDPFFLKLREYEHVTVPPLRKRKEDIPLLVNHFLNQFLDSWDLPDPERVRVRLGIKSDGKLEAGVLKLLQKQRWEQNVIQLKAHIRSVLVVNPQTSIQERENLEVMKMILMIDEGTEFSLPQSLSVIEEAIIRRALAKNAGHEPKTAQSLGISERSFRRKTIPA
ncbi:MAG: sigma 54-interacting transcriptional regulator [Ignavibacteriales bacterium]|nr:sigma 54-interacting transcriptional regulator [Ignavibacteriales bacterium]